MCRSLNPPSDPIAGVQTASRVRTVARSVDSTSAIELLKRENELLKSTLNEVATSISPETDLTSILPEDFWSPATEVEADHEFVEEYGSPTPIPSHDGTECFKWDNTMWSAAEHFKVRFATWAGGSDLQHLPGHAGRPA